MRENRVLCRILAAVMRMAWVCALLPIVPALAQTSHEQQQTAAVQGGDLTIVGDSTLADTYPGAQYEFHFMAHGGVPSLHWTISKGALPRGLKLEDAGLLHGSPQQTGEFQFTAVVTDSSKPAQSVQKQFLLRVRSAMTLNWKSPARVNGNRIDGTVMVENTTPDPIDLTYVVLAVSENGRATAIGYQHFELEKGKSKELPFGDTLPHGGYVVHVDAVGEVASRNLIYRERLQTPGPLQVTVGP